MKEIKVFLRPYFLIKVILKELKKGNRHQYSQFNGTQWGKLTKNGARRETQKSMGQTLKLRGCPVENGTSGHPTLNINKF